MFGSWLNSALKGMVEEGASMTLGETVSKTLNELLQTLPGNLAFSIPGLSVRKIDLQIIYKNNTSVGTYECHAARP